MNEKTGSRWRGCADCGKLILVNVGSADDNAVRIVCDDCRAEIQTDWQLSSLTITPKGLALLAGGDGTITTKSLVL